MMELKQNALAVSFPEFKYTPGLTIDFQRTLRIPDDGKNYPLPPGLGTFPLRHIDDFAARAPQKWLARGGVLLPMWQAEALWICFRSQYVGERDTVYPFAIKVATGKISAITGEKWRGGLDRSPQNYVVAPKQPWLDGYCVEKGIIRQFVAMPLGEGYSVEEQITGEAEFGGLQIEVFPMRTEIFEKRFPKRFFKARRGGAESILLQCEVGAAAPACADLEMGLAAGGQMRQEIYKDPYSIHDWDTEKGSRCFIHIVNSKTWMELTGERPPSEPITAESYARFGYPWFDYYDAELKAVQGSDVLGALKSVKEVAQSKRVDVLPHNDSVSVTNIVNLRAGLKTNQVREGSF
jgi:hypothetical protein